MHMLNVCIMYAKSQVMQMFNVFTLCMESLFVCVEVLRPSQQLRTCQAGQLPISTVPGQA